LKDGDKDKIAKVLLIKCSDGLEAHPTRKKIVGWALSIVLVIFAILSKDEAAVEIARSSCPIPAKM